jgi:hypothetical protein
MGTQGWVRKSLSAVMLMIEVFWVVTPSQRGEIYRNFKVFVYTAL